MTAGAAGTAGDGAARACVWPVALHGLARRWDRRTSAGGALGGEMLIGTCAIPRGGAMYPPVAAVIGGLASTAYGLTLLTAYNLAFIAPLFLLVVVASGRDILTGLSRVHITHRAHAKAVTWSLVVLVGLFALL